MIRKWRAVVIGPGISFGPLFMTQMAGHSSGDWLVPVGVMMLISALFVMVSILKLQSAELQRLRAAISSRSGELTLKP